MKKYVFSFLAFCLCGVTTAQANWEYTRNSKRRDVWNGDDGMRFVLSVRGGAAMGRASIKNEIGGLTGEYMVNVNNDAVVTMAWYNWQVANNPSFNSSEYAEAGYGLLGDLPAKKDFSDVSFIAGFSAGLTMPKNPQWRFEFGFDHIAETDYNANPLFEGVLNLSSGYVVEAQSGGVQSSLTSDIYSIMAFYDFFDGLRKPVEKVIPYIGVGAGYADTKAILQLTDSYGDLSSLYDLQKFGVVEDGIIQFNKAETSTSNLVPIGAVGFSYGLNERMFFDVGLRAMYMRKVKWQLASSDKELRRDWFSAEKMVYLNAMVGIRVEF